MSKSHPLPAATADEVDAFSPRSRRIVSFQRGETAAIKNRYNRRVRRDGKAQIRREAW